jgi:RsiW-degrading membrane proteinase PrsW (M82 family)
MNDVLYMSGMVWPILPGLLWLWFFYRTDRQPEPKRVVAATFLFGVFAIVPAFLVERAAGNLVPYESLMQQPTSAGMWAALFGCFLVVAPAEELAKFAVVRLYSFRQQAFDEPMDGLIYAAAAALGFASLENILYVFDFETGTLKWQALGMRAVLALPGHVIFAVQWGYALGRRRMDPGYPVVSRVLLAVALHGVYDFILVYPTSPSLVVLFMSVMVPIVIRQFRVLRQLTPAPAPAAQTPTAD